MLDAALIGYRTRYGEIEQKIAELRLRLGGGSGKNRMSRAARKRIADAQNKRWAAFRKSKEQ